MHEVQRKPEVAARRVIAWGWDNGTRFEIAKDEAILFSRNRAH